MNVYVNYSDFSTTIQQKFSNARNLNQEMANGPPRINLHGLDCKTIKWILFF